MNQGGLVWTTVRTGPRLPINSLLKWRLNAKIVKPKEN